MAQRLLPGDGVDTARRLDPAVVVGTSLVAGGVALVAPVETIVAFGCVGGMAYLRQRIHWQLLLLAASCLLFARVRAGHRVASYEAERGITAAAMGAPKACSAQARVVSSPVRARQSLRWDGLLTDVSCDDAIVAWSGRATLYGGPDDLARGDQVEIVATLGEPQRLWNPALGDPRPADAYRGAVRSGGTMAVRMGHRGVTLASWIDRARAAVRARIDASFAPTLSPMARALVLGESDLSPEDDQAFRAAGLSHLLAVSGMHLVIVLACILRVAEAFLLRIEPLACRVDTGRVAATAAVPLVWSYAAFAGAGGSTVRAAWMVTAALLARALGRRTDPSRAFGLSLMAMAATEPLIAFDLSFLLSGAATGGLLAFGAPLGNAFARRLPARLSVVARALATTVAATIPCAPILARYAPAVPLGSAFANLLAVPVGESVALPLCLMHSLLFWWPAAEHGCATVASCALVIVRLVARAFSVPQLAVDVPQPTSWQLVVVALALAASALRGRRLAVTLTICLAAFVVLEVFIRSNRQPRGVLRATFLDVGQGDCAIVDLPDGQAMVIDGGGLVGSPIDIGTRALAPELRARRRSELAAVVLTHPHPDHFGGLVTGLSGVRFAQLWDTGQGEAEGAGTAYAELLATARLRGAAVRRPGDLCGNWLVGGARIEVLAPCPAFAPDLGANDNSFVLRITYGARSLLFVGDSEKAAESALLEKDRDRLRADVLKVGHHGSRTSSSSPFIAAVMPREAVISAGSRNRFGHPAAATIRTLEAAGVRVWRTDRQGAITVTTDGISLEMDPAHTL